MNEKITFKVIGDRTIHCNGCENSINFALNQMPEVSEAAADRVSQMIEITPGGEVVDTAKFVKELDWLGYQVELVQILLRQSEMFEIQLFMNRNRIVYE